MILIILLAAIQASSETLPAEAAEKPPVFFPKSGFNAALSAPNKGLAIGLLRTGSKAVVLLARRDSPGEVEIHDTQDDVIIAREGQSDILVGGVGKGSARITPTEWRGGAILGGTHVTMTEGDILYIPAGSPHQFTPRTKTFSYIGIRSPTSEPRLRRGGGSRDIPRL